MRRPCEAGQWQGDALGDGGRPPRLECPDSPGKPEERRHETRGQAVSLHLAAALPVFMMLPSAAGSDHDQGGSRQQGREPAEPGTSPQAFHLGRDS